MNRNRPDDERTTRIVTLDFNGGSHVYRNPELGLIIPAQIEPGEFSAIRRAGLVSTLNREYASESIHFSFDVTQGTSTVHIGRTHAFDAFGHFLGLAEGIGSGDAFVLLDASANDAELVNVIRHEAGHILGTLDHGGAGLARYAWERKNYDYRSAYLANKYPDQYKSYLRKIITTETIHIPVLASSGEDMLTVSYTENGTTIEYVYDSASINSEVSTEHVSQTNNIECYQTASGIWARNIQVYGGNVDHCTAARMVVSGNYDYDGFSGYEGGEYASERFNYKYYQGVAVGCVVKAELNSMNGNNGTIIVEGNGVARQCTADSIMVKGELDRSHYYEDHSGTETEEFKLFNGLAENCTVNGGTLRVDFGGIANDIIVRSGDAVIGSAGDIAAWREEDARAVEEGENPPFAYNIELAEDSFARYGSAKANNLIVEKGNVQVNYGGELHNAKIDGNLNATEGASLGGVITCKSVDLSNVTPGTNITIKLDLNDYKVANYTEYQYNEDGSLAATIEFFANYTTRTHYFRDGVVVSVTDGTFDNKDGRFDMTNWKYTFAATIGKVDEKALPYIVVDFGGTEKDFDSGRLYFDYPSTTHDVQFQLESNLNKWEEDWGPSYGFDENGVRYEIEDYFFREIDYNSMLFGEAADVLWLENGWDDETEYTVVLPDDVMKGATEELTITDKGPGNNVLTDAELKGNKLVFKGGAESGNYSVKAEEKDGRDHECDLELWVIPEEIPVLGKAGTKKLSEILKKMQTTRVFEFSAGLPHNIHTELCGMPFDLSDTGITITADFPQMSFSAKVQGKIEWKLNKDTAGTGKQLKLVIDLSGDNYLSITNTKGKYDWDLVGEFKIPDFKLGKFEFSNMAMKVDVGKSSYSASAYVKLPWIKYAFGGSIGFVDGYWDSMAIGVDSLNVPLGTSGLFLQKIEGGISGIATELNLTFQGTLGLTAGPTFKVEYVDWLGIDSGEYSLCEITVLGTLTTNGNLSGEAETSILGGFITGGGGAGIKDGEFFSKGKYTLLNGCITVDGELRAGLSTGIKITGKGKMTVPAEKIFGPLAGMTLTVNAEASINVQNPDASYVKAWSDLTVMGYQVAMGFKYSFNKGLELTGCDDEKKDGGGSPKRSLYALNPVLFDLSPEYSLRGAAEPSASKTFTVTSSGLTLFQVNLSISDAIMSLAFGGVEYTQVDIAAGLYENMRIVSELSGLASELSGANCITVAVNDAALGEWTVNAYGDAEATFNAYSLLSTAPAPVLTAVEVGEDARSATLRYTADFSGLTDATISIFRADAGTTDFTSGSKLAEIAAADATGVYEYVMPDEVEGGDYLFYLAVNSDGRAPVYSAVSDVYTFRILDTEAPDRIQTFNSEWKSNGTVLTWEAPWDDKGVAGYKVSYRMLMEKSEDEETDIEELDSEAPEGGSEEVIEEEIVWTEADVKTNSFTFDSVPNGTYIVRVAAYDAADNLGAWSEEQSSLVLTVANAKYKNVALTEDLELAEYESATGITAGDFAIKAETNTLISGSVLGDAETGGIVENSTVNGVVSMLAGSRGFNLTVNGTLNVAGAVDGATVNDGGTLIIGSRGSANGITVNAGGSLALRIGAEYSCLTLAYGASLVFINSGSGNSSGKYLLTDDIRTAGTLRSTLYLDTQGHKIRFEQYNQSAEYEDSEWYGIFDRISLISDLDKLIGDALEVEIDSTAYGRFKISDKAQYFSGTITVIDHEDQSSAEVGFDKCALVGHAACKLVKHDDGLFLETARAEIDAPLITVKYADSNAYDYIELTATPAENTDVADHYTFRYSLNADMSDAVSLEVNDWYGGYALISKNDLMDNATYYVQANVENTFGVTSAWSDAASFTVVPKVLPDAPTTLTVSGATNKKNNSISFTATGVEDSNYTVREYRFRYADNPEMKNAVILTTGQRLINYAYIQKSDIEDGRDYYVQAGVKQGNDWSYWTDAVVFNTQGWDFDGLTVGPEPDGDVNYYDLEGKRAKNVKVIDGGYFYGGGDVDGLVVEAGGFFRDDNSDVTNAVVNGGRYWLDQGSVVDLVVTSGTLRLMSGTLKGTTIIGSDAVMDLDGLQREPDLSGTILIQGQFTIYYLHQVISTNAEFVFDIGAHEAEALRNKSFVEYVFVLGGASKFTAKLDDTPEIGEYRITSLYNVPENGLYVSLEANDGTKLGTMRIGDAPILYNGLYYSLIDQKNVAYLHVSDNQDPPFIGAVKLSKNGTIYDSNSSYRDITVSASDECDYVLVGDAGQLYTVTVGNGGKVDLGGAVFGATIENGGQLTIKEGGRALSNIITVKDGGNVTIEGGKVDLGAAFHLAGGTITVNGTLQGWEDDSGNEWGATRHWFVYDLDKLTAAPADAMISDYEMLTQCNPEFTAYMSADQKNVSYKLLGNASGFDRYVSLNVEGHDYQEYLRIGQECSIGDSYYSLAVVDNVLTLTVSSTRPVHAPSVWADVTEPTTGSVTITASFDETAKTKEYSLDGVTWKTYKKAIKVTENGTIYFRGKDSKGNTSPVVSYEVTNIQKASPEQEKPSVPDLGGNDTPVKSDGTLNPAAIVEDNPLEQGGDTNIVMDAAGSVEQDGYNNFVGEEDKVDNAKITLEKAAKLSFTVKADSKVKLTFYELVEKTDGTYKKKSLKTVTVSSKNGGEKTTASVLVEGGWDKLYYVAVENKNKKDQGAYYNVSLTTEGKNACEFFSDGDDGDNNYLYDKKQKDVWNSNVRDAEALEISSGDIGKAIQIDTDTETVVDHDGFTNYVGFGDAMDFRKIELKSAAKLSFDLAKTTGGAAKLVIYTENDKGKMVVVNSKLTVTTKAAAPSGSVKNPVVLQKGVYYIAVQSTDAKKGKEAYYNVSLNANSVFYEDGDSGMNDFDSKTKKVDDVVREDENALTLYNGEMLRFDGVLSEDEEINHDGWTNFVGTGDDSDIVRINANNGMKLSLKVTATDAVSLVIYGLQKNGTLKALKTVKSKNNVAELVNFELKAKSAPGGQFFLGVTSTNAKKGSAAFYNVDVVSVSGQDSAPFSASVASSLAMPETDSLAITDSLSFGNYGADALADVSASALAELDDKSAWQNLTLA